ncbi:LysR family transcriptional regulator [Burkholderia ubonensis]|uniref:LysR family transcriptional regulator n=1 Tax=Burkholderia ubonensis TaxID=101571 RepID=UPI00075A9AE6|nr:LysR family transcriptional regulator [Burkholderia ubonensis]KVU69349.1 LysR family transcriptional regulator [Burkholderia ubonensis]KWH12536.1 LysR family transcriptional regulator [Burkholderia ubonensis]
MDSLQSMWLYTRAVELGSFSAVAREEKIGQPTMSKVVSAMEKQLGVRLLQRTTTSLTPTDEGRRFYERCKQMLETYADAVADVRGQAQRPVGKLTVSAPMGLGELRLNALVLEFLAQYPEIEVELNLTDRIIDLVEESIDVAIRIGNALPPDAVARNVAWSPRVLVATPDYLKRAPRIRRPEDLLRHPFVGYARAAVGAQLELSKGAETIVVPTNGRYRVNNSVALRECYLTGIGLGSAPAWVVQDLIDAGRLVRVLPKWAIPPHSVHLITPSRRYPPLRARVFLQFMAERIPMLPGFHAPGV